MNVVACIDNRDRGLPFILRISGFGLLLAALSRERSGSGFGLRPSGLVRP